MTTLDKPDIVDNVNPDKLSTQNWLKFLPEVTPLASARLDALRAIAAFLVVISHVRGIFFPLYSELETRGPVITALYALGTLGHSAVQVFFILSGFLIALSVFRMQSRGTWGFRRYFIQRLTRLWIVLIPALILTLVWDFSGIALWGEAIYQGIPENRYVLDNSLASLNFQTFAGNLFFLQKIFVDTLGTNGPMWSLANEWWYYVAFPPLLGLFGSNNWYVRLACLFSLIGLAFIVGFSITFLFSIWLGGVFALLITILAKAKGFKVSRHWNWFWISALCISLALTNKFEIIGATLLVFSTIGTISFWLFPATDNSQKQAPHWGAFAKKMADFSFSLYLLHMPPIAFVHAYLYSRGTTKFEPGYSSLMFAIAITVIVMAYAYFVSLFTEAHNDKVRRYVEKRLL